jgi:hypothetical protein
VKIVEKNTAYEKIKYESNENVVVELFLKLKNMDLIDKKKIKNH